MTAAALLPPAAVARKRGLLAGWSRAGKLGLAVIAFWALVALAAPFLPTHALGEMSDAGVFQGMSAQRWLGTDYLGRHAHAHRRGRPYTLGVAFLATLLSCGVGRRSACWRR